RVIGPLDVEALDDRAHLAHVDLAAVHPDLAVLADRDQDVAGILVDGGNRESLVDLDPGLLHERGGDDEEDQQVHHEVEHRREIDAGLFRFGSVLLCHRFAYLVAPKEMSWTPPWRI